MTCLLLLSACSKEDDIITDKFGSLTGIVKDNFGNPLPSAKVEIAGKQRRTDDKGIYNFLLLNVGTHQVDVSIEHFIDKSVSVIISENQKTIKNIDLQKGSTHLSINKTKIDAKWKGLNTTLAIESNSEWHIDYKADWIYFSDTIGEANKSLNVTIRKNEYDKNRSDTIKVSTGSIERSLIINQTGQLRLLSYKALIGNDLTGEPDSIQLNFNQKMK